MVAILKREFIGCALALAVMFGGVALFQYDREAGEAFCAASVVFCGAFAVLSCIAVVQRRLCPRWIAPIYAISLIAGVTGPAAWLCARALRGAYDASVWDLLMLLGMMALSPLAAASYLAWRDANDTAERDSCIAANDGEGDDPAAKDASPG